MRVTPAVAIVPILVLLLTWLSLRAINPEAELFDIALGELDRFAMLENALYRDVFTARAGTLRNYDPLVREINALHDSLARLRETAAIDSETTAAPVPDLNPVPRPARRRFRLLPCLCEHDVARDQMTNGPKAPGDFAAAGSVDFVHVRQDTIVDSRSLGRSVRRRGNLFLLEIGEVRSGSGVFAPPLRPFDLMGCTGGLHDGPLIGGTEFLID